MLTNPFFYEVVSDLLYYLRGSAIQHSRPLSKPEGQNTVFLFELGVTWEMTSATLDHDESTRDPFFNFCHRFHDQAVRTIFRLMKLDGLWERACFDPLSYFSSVILLLLLGRQKSKRRSVSNTQDTPLKTGTRVPCLPYLRPSLPLYTASSCLNFYWY